MATRSKNTELPPSQLRVGTALSTVSGPSTLPPPKPGEAASPALGALHAKQLGTEALAAGMPTNENKAGEHGDLARAPAAGETVEPISPLVTGSTLSEGIASAKVGAGTTLLGNNATNGPLDRVRVDSSGRMLTTNQGVPVADNQSSLKAGLRGPTLMEDFILREKITHFDHERIPERVVHARGSAAHGFFECTKDITALTKAAPFSEVGKRTPAFVRFSTVAGERGSADTVRDVRGFAVKMYTDEGNWDLVGNNIPVFFIQDAMKFPDLVHAVKPEQHHAMPQASSAHDTFWDFVSLMPESTHMLLWQMSDRAIPRSYRMMQGFGVHTFRLVNDAGVSVFCKFHWQPVAGTHSLAWDEAVKIAGADADYHRRDLWEAIEAGNFPEWQLGLQVFTDDEADAFSFDVLDPTKIVPEELVPVQIVGRLVLDRNPDNFFAETEQVAFCTAHVVPGIDFSNDPLLAGRIHSYMDTQITRLGGPNFHEIPINAPIAQVHNNQRDGFHRQAIPRGRVAYEPSSLSGGCPFQAGMQGFTTYSPAAASGESAAAPATATAAKGGSKKQASPSMQARLAAAGREDKVRGKPEKFADHYTQATLFWKSQTVIEQEHIIRAFRFELTRVQTEAVRERVVSMLANVDDVLASGVAEGLGIEVPEPMPKALDIEVEPEVETSPSLSLFFRPGDGGVRGRRVALLVGNGVEGAPLRTVYSALAAAGAAPRFAGPTLGKVRTAEGDFIDVEVSMEAAPSVLYDAIVVPSGSVAALTRSGHAVEMVKDQYRHCKPIFALGSGSALLTAAGVPEKLPDGEDDPGLIVGSGAEDAADGATRFIAALAKHRHFERETDPPEV